MWGVQPECHMSRGISRVLELVANSALSVERWAVPEYRQWRLGRLRGAPSSAAERNRSVQGAPSKAITFVLVYSLGLMGILTPYASGPAPIWYSSGYIPTKDFWKLGGIMGALYTWFCLGSACRSQLGCCGDPEQAHFWAAVLVFGSLAESAGAFMVSTGQRACTKTS
jgi:Sodium:sulfate symporter transmembrane region